MLEIYGETKKKICESKKEIHKLEFQRISKNKKERTKHNGTAFPTLCQS